VEIAYHDGAHGEGAILTFDGTVVEFFAPGKAGSVARMHVRMLWFKVDGPNRKGYYEIDFSTSPRGLGGITIYVPTDAWPSVYQLLQAVSAATAG